MIEINGEREIGIAIGTDVKSHEQDGQVYIDEQHELVTITSNRMSFWLNNAEVAYFANDGMSINQANVATEIVLGDVHFIYKESGVIDVKWEGGN